MAHQCYKCGFQTNNVGDFMGTQGNGHHYWTMFICPQCSNGNPPVAEVPYEGETERPPFKLSDWILRESSEGIRVVVKENGCTVSNMMHPQHPLMDQPATLLDPSYVGMSIRDMGHRLKLKGKARSRKFHTECEDFKRIHFPLVNMHQDKEAKAAYIAFTDECRELNQVGPHAPSRDYSGKAIMKAAHIMF